MNWTSFSLLMLGSYSLYYGVNFLLDFLKQSANSRNGQPVQSLQLADSPQPVLVDESDFTAVELQNPIKVVTRYRRNVCRSADAKWSVKPIQTGQANRRKVVS